MSKGQKNATRAMEHANVGSVLEVEMSKKWTPLWFEARLEMKVLKALGVQTNFGGLNIEKMRCIVAGSTF